eukprot:CAMPEP_0179282900 /NCGR_PEP_ID=MMETSP0797-20121207/37898_1 /TAXON_ID=47934 /ORGANISM="Dinophysis acuminata, Strain DAEP01" /LENGTH=112 /DNA_ID=CAMNT_0020991635 /DNA_START=30 /DNA_END=364 /DNA_ORIENTATION=+
MLNAPRCCRGLCGTDVLHIDGAVQHAHLTQGAKVRQAHTWRERAQCPSVPQALVLFCHACPRRPKGTATSAGGPGPHAAPAPGNQPSRWSRCSTADGTSLPLALNAACAASL